MSAVDEILDRRDDKVCDEDHSKCKKAFVESRVNLDGKQNAIHNYEASLIKMAKTGNEDGIKLVAKEKFGFVGSDCQLLATELIDQFGKQKKEFKILTHNKNAVLNVNCDIDAKNDKSCLESLRDYKCFENCDFYLNGEILRSNDNFEKIDSEKDMIEARDQKFESSMSIASHLMCFGWFFGTKPPSDGRQLSKYKEGCLKAMKRKSFCFHFFILNAEPFFFYFMAIVSVCRSHIMISAIHAAITTGIILIEKEAFGNVKDYFYVIFGVATIVLSFASFWFGSNCAYFINNNLRPPFVHILAFGHNKYSFDSRMTDVLNDYEWHNYIAAFGGFIVIDVLIINSPKLTPWDELDLAFYLIIGYYVKLTLFLCSIGISKWSKCKNRNELTQSQLTQKRKEISDKNEEKEENGWMDNDSSDTNDSRQEKEKVIYNNNTTYNNNVINSHLHLHVEYSNETNQEQAKGPTSNQSNVRIIRKPKKRSHDR